MARRLHRAARAQANTPSIILVRAREPILYKPPGVLPESLPLWPFGLDQV